MAVVKDRQKTMDFSHEVTKKLMDIIIEEGKQFHVNNDPAEHIYLLICVAGCFMSKIAMSIEGFSHIYGIDGLNAEKALEIMNDMSKGHINFNREHTDFFKNYKNNSKVMQ